MKLYSIPFFILAFFGCSDTDSTLLQPLALDKEVKYVDNKRGFYRQYDLELDSSQYEFLDKRVHKNQNFTNIFLNAKITYNTINLAIEQANNIESFDPNKVKWGTRYTLIYSKGQRNTSPRCVIFHINRIEHIVFDFRARVKVRAFQEPVRYVERVSKATIKYSLFETIKEKKLNYDLLIKMSNIFAWTVDFFRLQRGDNFKVIYSEGFVKDSISVGVNRIKAIVFVHDGKKYYAFNSYYISKDKYTSFFNQYGINLRKTFLKSPLEFGRLSSRYSGRRFHPVLKVWKAHRGTDYAAPYGTPILSTADGKIETYGYTSGNGRFVKVRHNSIYATQYLHMSRFAKGIYKGKRVRQGQVIGYVGSSGLATGPHVCYRFWYRGMQRDPLRVKMPQAPSIKSEYKDKFQEWIHPYKDRLDRHPYHDLAQIRKKVKKYWILADELMF